jgi:hypothetical protein
MDWISTYGHVSDVFQSFKPSKYFVRLLSKAYGLPPELKRPAFRVALPLSTFGSSVAAVHRSGDIVNILRYMTLDCVMILCAELA